MKVHCNQSSSKPAAKRRAVKPERSGLIHVASMMAGVPIPPELQALKYSAVIVEAGQGDGSSDQHAMVNKLVQSGVPVLLAGSPGELQFVHQSMKRAMEDEPLNVFDIAMYCPAREGTYLFAAQKLSVVSKNPVGFRVCSDASCFAVCIVVQLSLESKWRSFFLSFA